jgi:hypothetical protein
MTHYGDPCIHCGIGHDDVPPGPCQGDKAKAVPIAWRELSIRWDKVAHYLIRMSTGEVTHRWEHIEMSLPYTWLKGVRYDRNLRDENGR